MWKWKSERKGVQSLNSVNRWTQSTQLGEMKGGSGSSDIKEVNKNKDKVSIFTTLTFIIIIVQLRFFVR